MKQDSYTKANESGEEAQKETMRLVDNGLPQSEIMKAVTVTVRPGLKVKYNEGQYKSSIIISGLVWVLENLESPGILLWYFPGLESPGKRPLALESPGNLLNSTKRYEVYGRQ